MVAAEVLQYTKQQVIKQHAQTFKMHVCQCSIYWQLPHYPFYVHFMTSGPSRNYISDESMIYIVSCQWPVIQHILMRIWALFTLFLD